MMTGRHSGKRSSRYSLPNRVRTGIIIAVTAVWVINFTAPLILQTYTPPPEINLAFMGIVGILTASYRHEDEDDRDD